MKTVLILHCIGGHAGIHWQQWLHDMLTAEGVAVIMPNLSDSQHPDRKQWMQEIIAATSDINSEDLVIVGHSLGVTSALDFIEQLDSPVHGLVSVSGFGIDYGLELNSYFLQEKSIDFAKVRANTKQAAVFYSDDDPYVTQETLKHLADELQVEPIIIHKGGHLNSETGYTEFPALFEATKAIIACD